MVIIWRCKYNCTLNNNIKTNVPENFTHRWCDTDTDCPRFLLKHTIQDQGEHWCANGFARCFYMDAKKPPLFFFFFDTATIAHRTTTLFAATTTTIHGSQYSAKILVVTAKASQRGVDGRRNSAVEKKSSTGCHTHTTIIDCWRGNYGVIIIVDLLFAISSLVIAESDRCARWENW